MSQIERYNVEAYVSILIREAFEQPSKERKDRDAQSNEKVPAGLTGESDSEARTHKKPEK